LRKGLGLSTRLAIAIVSLVILTAVSVGYLGYHNLARVAVARTLASLDTLTRSQAVDVAAIVESARADIKGFRNIIGIDELIGLSRDPAQQSAGGQTLAQWKSRIANRLAVELEAKPDLLKYRLIGVADGGREIVRAERQESGIVRVVPDGELQTKGDREFFKQALSANKNEIVVSPVELNQDHGAITTPYVPVIRISAPLFAPDGSRFGVLIVNVDLRPVFARIAASARAGSVIYAVNDRGDYLLDPDKTREFGFEFGRRIRIQDDYPGLAAGIADGRFSPAVIADRNGEKFGVTYQPVAVPGGAPLAIVAVMPESRITSVIMTAWGRSSLVGGALAVILATLLAIVLARTMTGPLSEMTRAVEGFAADAPIKLPRDAGGEIGVLARAFESMVRESREKTAALRREKEIFESIMNTMAECVLLIDASGQIVYENPAAMAIRAPPPGLPALPWDQAFETFHLDGVTPLALDERPSKRAIEGERIEQFEMLGRVRGSDRTIHVIVSSQPIRDTAGDLSGAVMVIRDVTELKEAERRLHQAQKLEAIGQLTGGVAHDFNNMLTVISGTAEILIDELADRPDLVSIARMIDHAAERGADLTRQLLAFARRQPLQPKNVDVNAIVGNIRQLLRPTIGEQIELEVRLEQDADPAHIDPSQLSSALLNLAVNARDAMPDGGKLLLETGNVVLDEHYAERNPDVRPGRYVLIAVSDTGTGMPAAVLARAFEPFFTTKGIGKGTGLGLSMVYGFVKQSGGHIRIYSEEGHGTTIKLYLPRADAEVDAAPTIGSVEGGSETILLVEDDELVRNFAVAQLQGLGYRTIAVADGIAALAVVERGTAFDLLFTDVIMPGGLNGRQLADAAAKLRPIKVLFTSGYTENAIVHHGRLDAGVLLLTKPFRRADLARLVRAALAQGFHVPAGSDVPPRRSAAG
jgi:signal transduction histidine kinase/HAMP domain-containing protein